jgi:hypothetical protein
MQRIKGCSSERKPFQWKEVNKVVRIEINKMSIDIENLSESFSRICSQSMCYVNLGRQVIGSIFDWSDLSFMMSFKHYEALLTHLIIPPLNYSHTTYDADNTISNSFEKPPNISYLVTIWNTIIQQSKH